MRRVCSPSQGHMWWLGYKKHWWLCWASLGGGEGGGGEASPVHMGPHCAPLGKALLLLAVPSSFRWGGRVLVQPPGLAGGFPPLHVLILVWRFLAWARRCGGCVWEREQPFC